MVNTQVLDSKISDSGLKVGFICERLGISRQAFNEKKKNVYPFRASEVFVICTLLGIDESDKKDIFFASEVHEKVNGDLNG